ncbi:MAG TPA: hypothetical protein VFM37_06210 [Pseudonocardiaceae bacterium]|nr:hypothetical protein [Pseudonocardiaceae bacterium]
MRPRRHEGVHHGDAVAVSSSSGTDLVSGNRADKVGEYDDVGILLTCNDY